MAHFTEHYWAPGQSGLTRRDRKGCQYRSYVPDVLSGRAFTLDGDVAADVADAEAAIIRLNQEASALADTENLARLLMRAEAVASSRIEGLQIGPRRLLRAEAMRSQGAAFAEDISAEEILGNVDAMSEALEFASAEAPVTTETILRIHERLLSGTRLAEHAGKLRTVQNWVGGSGYNPCSAEYVPPPAECVPALVEDLAVFCNDESLPAVAQAAIAHAQFETIHPFVDGNGRVGRALVHLVLRRRGIAPRSVPPVSLVLAAISDDYIAGLIAYRHEGAPTSADAINGLNRWLALFSASCTRAVSESREFEDRIARIQQGWRTRVGRVRSGSAADALLDALPGTPIVTAASAATLTDRSFKAASRGIGQLVSVGVLRQITIGRRNRAFEASEIIDEFAWFESELTTP